MLAETTVVENRMEFLEAECRGVSVCPALRRLAWLALLGFTLIACSPTPTPCPTGCSAMEATPCVTPIPVAGPPVVAMDLSPDGSHLAILTTQELFVYQVDADTFRELWYTSVAGHLMNVAFSSNERLLVSKTTRSSGFESIAFVWNVNTGEIEHTWGYDLQVLDTVCVAINPDGTVLALRQGLLSDVVLWDIQAESELRMITYGDEVNELGGVFVNFLPPCAVAWPPDGEKLAFVTPDRRVGRVIVWNLVEDRAVHVLAEHNKSWVMNLAFSPDGKKLATRTSRGTVILWDLTTGEPLFTLQGRGGSGGGLVWSPDRTKVASGWGDGTATLWDVETGEQLSTLQDSVVLCDVYADDTRGVGWSAEGTELFVGTPGGVVIWDVETGERLRLFTPGEE